MPHRRAPGEGGCRLERLGHIHLSEVCVIFLGPVYLAGFSHLASRLGPEILHGRGRLQRSGDFAIHVATQRWRRSSWGASCLPPSEARRRRRWLLVAQIAALQSRWNFPISAVEFQVFSGAKFWVPSWRSLGKSPTRASRLTGAGPARAAAGEALAGRGAQDLEAAARTSDLSERWAHFGKTR